MFWAARTLAYFGFLRSAELTVPNLASFVLSLMARSGRFWHVPEFQGTFPATVFVSERPQWQLIVASLTTSFKPWAVGLAMPISLTSARLLKHWLHSLLV